MAADNDNNDNYYCEIAIIPELGSRTKLNLVCRGGEPGTNYKIIHSVIIIAVYPSCNTPELK